MSEYRSIARVVKAHGRQGEVVAVPADGLPFLLRPGMRVALVPPELKGSRWHTVRSVVGGGTGQLVGLTGVDDLSAAKALVGKTFLASRDELPPDFDLHDATTLLGREVRERGGEVLGTISEVMYGPANDVWVIEGPRGEVLLPVVDAVVSEVPETGPIDVVFPEEFETEGGGR